jgi:hypothetical protein
MVDTTPVSSNFVRTRRRTSATLKPDAQITFFTWVVMVSAFHASVGVDAFMICPTRLGLRSTANQRFFMPGSRPTSSKIMMATDRGGFRDQYGESASPGDGGSPTPPGQDELPPLLVAEFQGDGEVEGAVPKSVEVSKLCFLFARLLQRHLICWAKTTCTSKAFFWNDTSKPDLETDRV